MTKQKPIQAKPHMGGRLLSALSAENVGIYNYTIKRDFRRNLDREQRSEGDVLFCPKMFTVDDVPAIVMPDTTDPITLIIMARHPNGRTMVVVGTATTLWRYYGRENALYFEPGYYNPGYYDETSVAWQEIGSGFSAPARRWECEATNGYLILNNNVDLPVTYRITDDRVSPIYELREMAIASVGTILVQDSHLLCMDIRQIKEDKFIEIMTPVGVAAGGVRGSYPSTSEEPLTSPPAPAAETGVFGSESGVFGSEGGIFGSE